MPLPKGKRIEPANEAYKVFFDDQVHAQVRMCTRGFYPGHLFLAMQPYGMMDAFGRIRELTYSHITMSLRRLNARGLVEFHGEQNWTHPKSLWMPVLPTTWTEFDTFALEHADD